MRAILTIRKKHISTPVFCSDPKGEIQRLLMRDNQRAYAVYMFAEPGNPPGLSHKQTLIFAGKLAA
jgi:hypothetical protein